MILIIIVCAAEPPKPREAVKWLFQASIAGYVRAQYQLGLCLHHGRGMDHNLPEAVCISLCIFLLPIYELAFCCGEHCETVFTPYIIEFSRNFLLLFFFVLLILIV